MAGNVDEEALHQLYLWVDNIPLSRPKRNLSRDFSDGVLVAEVIKFYFPKMVEMHNYVPANSLQQKLSNWSHLNRKVLNKLNFSVPEDVMRKIAQCAPGVIELVLIPLRQRLEERQRRRKQGSGSLQVPPHSSFSSHCILATNVEEGSWLHRMARATWMWVCPRRLEGKVPQIPREGGSSGEVGCQRSGLRGITRCLTATQASSSRSLKGSRSCWPRRRPCRFCR
ncbi:sperm flagellar protein 1 isoform X4 [Pteropus medius]|uniref:Sperm flagellar protein 1 n=1 Tax=Pteropus vampyrus TaxID=132908 RepID=A0A6P6D1F6_PTEVA|nr:sperm flagellar protein 1 isoform X3 [Pteropus vampyrus]XP_039719750.1 sperm flagellar protein 1 isoform X4 [Pteropus giganteus]